MQLKTFDVFSDYILKNISSITDNLYKSKSTPEICLNIIKALHYNQDFYKIPTSQRFSIIEPIVDFIYCDNKNKIDDYFIQGIILLFAATDTLFYQQFLNKHNILNDDVIYHQNFVNYFLILILFY